MSSTPDGDPVLLPVPTVQYSTVACLSGVGLLLCCALLCSLCGSAFCSAAAGLVRYVLLRVFCFLLPVQVFCTLLLYEYSWRYSTVPYCTALPSRLGSFRHEEYVYMSLLVRVVLYGTRTASSRVHLDVRYTGVRAYALYRTVRVPAHF